MAKEFTLKNPEVEAVVSEHGAELKSLKKNGKELMWQADPKYWGRTSPVLFPLVGNYFEKKSRSGDKVYEMGQHGFARDMDFELLEKTENSLLFELKDNEESKKKYPFDFVLQIGYVLKGAELEVKWTVKNPGSDDIFFSIGGHPAFNCDLNNAALKFSKDGVLLDTCIKAGIIAGDGSGCLSERVKAYAVDEGIMNLSDDLFKEDALIVEDRQADEVTLIDDKGADVLSVKFDAPLFGIWSPAGKHAPFVCIEPWYGRCDRVGFTGDISEREYGNKLAAGEEFAVSYTICAL
ncbi:MAG: aldose 1-epimerase family protein [Butyrivibrio sp.]|nr:aldose 1-epimerase family protein [Butyrivibrio sp.]